LKIALSLLMALNLIVPVLITALFPFQSISAQIPRFTNQTELPLTYKVKIDYKEYQYYSTIPPDPKVTSTIDVKFSAEALVHLDPLGDYAGNATGYYKEIRKNAGSCLEEDSYNLLLEGNATMDIRIDPDLREVSAGITAYNLTHVESYTGCGDNYRINAQDGQASTGCVFFDVNLQTGGTYKSDGYIDYKDEDDLQDVGCVMVLSTLEDRIDVTVDKPELSPLDSNPKSKVTVTATRVDGSKISGMKIKIEVCTSIGKADTDGHIHDRRNDPCDGGRPHGYVIYNGRSSLGEPMELTTDNNGQILLDYEPPWNPRASKDKTTHVVSWNFGKKLYISGEEKIVATKVGDPTVKGEKPITTKVPNLQVMPASSNCGSTNDYYFLPQGQHKCLFYGTSATNAAVARVAQAFTAKQDECKSRPGGICSIIDAQGNNVTFTITGPNKKLRITAMSLPWGGTHDIKGDWFNPHVTHNDGKAIDIGLVELGASEKNRRLLLWHVISLDSNFKNFEKTEGDPFSYTVDHFHVNFRS
jgi:hypothetical protein